MQNNQIEIINNYMACWNQHNAQKAVDFFHPQGAYVVGADGEPQMGKEDVLINVIKPFLDSFPDAVWSITSAPKINGGTVTFEWLFTGTFQVDALGLGTEPNRQKLNLIGDSVFVLENGLIKHQTDNFDGDEFMRQICGV